MAAEPTWAMSVLLLLGIGGALAIIAIIAVIVIAAVSRRS